MLSIACRIINLLVCSFIYLSVQKGCRDFIQHSSFIYLYLLIYAFWVLLLDRKLLYDTGPTCTMYFSYNQAPRLPLNHWLMISKPILRMPFTL